MLRFPTIVLVTVFISQTWNILTQATNAWRWPSTDGKFGKQVPAGSVKDWAGNPTATPACLPSYFSWYLPFNIYSILLSSPAKLSRKILCRKSCSFDTVSNFPQDSRWKKTCRAIPAYTTVCQVTDSQIFFGIQTQLRCEMWVCHWWAKIDTSGSFSSEPILY